MTTRPEGQARAARIWEASLVGGLLGLSALAWLVTQRSAAPAMRLGLLTGAGDMPSTSMAGPASLAALGLFLLTWVVMMVAMMFPAITPVVVTFDRWVLRTHRSRSATLLFVAGYLLVWATAGVVVYAAVTRLVPLLPMGDAAVRIGAAGLVLAGVYEFTPLKEVCLRHCRSPLAFIAEHAVRLRRGGLAGTRVGAIHGVFCLGCCWALMAVLVLLGMMSLAWMAAVAAVILLEKALPRGWPVSGLVGAVLIATGTVLLLSPQTLPAFA